MSIYQCSPAINLSRGITPNLMRSCLSTHKLPTCPNQFLPTGIIQLLYPPSRARQYNPRPHHHKKDSTPMGDSLANTISLHRPSLKCSLVHIDDDSRGENRIGWRLLTDGLGQSTDHRTTHLKDYHTTRTLFTTLKGAVYYGRHDKTHPEHGKQEHSAIHIYNANVMDAAIILKPFYLHLLTVSNPVSSPVSPPVIQTSTC